MNLKRCVTHPNMNCTAKGHNTLHADKCNNRIKKKQKKEEICHLDRCVSRKMLKTMSRIAFAIHFQENIISYVCAFFYLSILPPLFRLCKKNSKNIIFFCTRAVHKQAISKNCFIYLFIYSYCCFYCAL